MRVAAERANAGLTGKKAIHPPQKNDQTISQGHALALPFRGGDKGDIRHGIAHFLSFNRYTSASGPTYLMPCLVGIGPLTK
jgi:hypothetical protein